MSGGVELYEKLIEVLNSNDLNKINSFISQFSDPKNLNDLSFYYVSAIALDINDYARKLRALDPRGLGGKGKGAKKKDVILTCTRAKRILEQKKKELREKELNSQRDHSQKYREFLPRGITKDMDNQASNHPRAKKKGRSG